MKKARKQRTRTVVSNEHFVQAWAEADSISAVASETGMSYGSVQARVARLRKAGVKLPRFARLGVQVDAAALNKLFAKTARGRR